MTVPADTPDLATLEFIGSISTMTLDRLTCDTTVTTMIVDGEQVPLDMGREKRLFPAHLRKALYHRDQCCIKCGAPPGRTHAHHIVHVRREARVFRSEVKDLRYRAVTAA